MKRVITQCPICGEWDGPADGEAIETIIQVCDLCREAKEAAEIKDCPDCKESA